MLFPYTTLFRSLGLAEDVSEDVPDLDLDAVLDVPVVYASGKAGRASTVQPADGQLPDNEDLEPLFATIMEHIPAPTYDETEVLQAHVTNLDYSPVLLSLELLLLHNGTINNNYDVVL